MVTESAVVNVGTRMELEDLQLAELLDFRPDLGIIRLHRGRDEP
jgi:hypothetical protein